NLNDNATPSPPGTNKSRGNAPVSPFQVSTRNGTTPVATIPAAVETAKAAPAGSGYSTKTEGDGTKSVTSVFFAGKKIRLNLDQQAVASAQSAGTQGNK